MSAHDSDSRNVDSDRRGFLAQVGAGTVAMLAAPALLRAETVLPNAPFDDKWLDNLKGSHRQYFDATAVNSGWVLGYAMNWLDTMKSTYGVTDKDLNAVIGFRHFGIPPAYTDAIWAKYKLGEFTKITDPATKAPATRNIFFNSKPGDVPFPGMAIEKMQARGTTFVVCNVAHTVLSGMLAQKMGLAADAAKAEWEKGLIQGFTLVPSGVLAVHRAQEKGKCTYCYAG
jgi:intracellular sulfur oxidation DsrE/DsrF family protein